MIILLEIMKMNFNETAEFKKDFKKLQKKYISLNNDLEEFKKILKKEPFGIGKHFNILTENDSIYIIKARFFCKSLKKKTLRIIYAYIENNQRIEMIGIEFIEIYFKGNKINENKKRIKEYFKEKQ